MARHAKKKRGGGVEKRKHIRPTFALFIVAN